MCGIAGFCDFTKKSDKQTLVKMTDVLHHRGPDDSGYSFYENGFAHIGLGHRRLSILDLSSHGHQPMSFQNLEIVYNGEVYNFSEIAKELESYGYIFESHSDTEVILKAYHHWGIKAVDKFIGMFALVIYDKENEKLILLRDRTGIKPLYIYNKNNFFMFASELKSFHKSHNFEKEICLEALSLYFQFGYILEPYSIFKNTFKLKSGHYAELDLKTRNLKEYKYWDVINFYNQPKLDISFNEAKKETEKLLISACEYRMISDVPVGVFLSGGYDSTAVTAILQKNRTNKLKTFTIGFEEEKYNEAHHAKKVAEYLGTDHTEYYCTQKDALDVLTFLPEIWDEPFSDTSVIPTVMVSKLAREKVIVSLSADGGDEIFGGYDKYIKSNYYFKKLSKVPFRDVINSKLSKINPNKIPILNKTYNFDLRFKKANNLLGANNIVDVMNIFVNVFTKSELDSLLNINQKDLFTFNNIITSLDQIENKFEKMMAFDYKTYQIDDILLKVDRATMSVGLEGREPFLDHRIIEYVSKLPIDYKINNGNKKHLLKSIVHEYVPRRIMKRPKMGFSMPLQEWLGDAFKDLVSDYLSESNLNKVSFLNQKYIIFLKKQWLKDKTYNTKKIWSLIVLLMWYEKWIEGEKN